MLRVIGIKRDLTRGTEPADSVHGFGELRAKLAEADYVVLTCPLTSETEKVINGDALHRMKKTACLINVARGRCVDEPALVPPSAFKRMYKIVKPPESDHAHRPPLQRGLEDEGGPDESRDVDETLRLGMPALKRGGGWGNSLILLGGVAAVFLLLAIAIWQLLPPFGREPDLEGAEKQTGHEVD